MEKELPKIDLPEEWVAGTDISRELLSLYTNYPVRLKCEMLVYCADGRVEASVNLNRLTVRPRNVVVLTPGSVFQVDSVEGDLRLYFVGFSSQYLSQATRPYSIADSIYLTLGTPVLAVQPGGATLLEEYMRMLVHLYEFLPEKGRALVSPNLYADIHTGLSLIFRANGMEHSAATKSEQLSRQFAHLVMQHYAEVRNVAWYAEQLGITHAHLCNTVKQVTGRTCVDIISTMVVMDANSQLKSTRLSVQEISDSLHFANMSFFGKYFKRYVGMSPLEYRNTD